MPDDLRAKTIRLASSFPKESSERAALLRVLKVGADIPPEPLEVFWKEMTKNIVARPKDVESGANKIDLQWMEGPGVAPYVTIKMRNGVVGADVDGEWITDPKKAGRAVQNWIELLHEEAGTGS